MKVYIASDHAGFALKERIKPRLPGREFADLGAFSEESVDYPDIALKLARIVSCEPGGNAIGILVCGTGIGMSIAANKVRGIRAALAHNAMTARMAREHNNANVLCLGSRATDEKTALECVEAFLSAEFAGNSAGGERHLKRVKKITEIEGSREFF